jgi:hypothetical protein
VQEFALIDIDAVLLKGKRVTKARLHLHGLADDALGRATVSTIMDEWVEGTATGYKMTPGASSFAWARTGERRWGGDQPDMTGVIHGAGGSVWSFADATPRDAEGWQTIGTAKSWQKADDLSLFYPTPHGPVPSLRLKTFRAGQQLVEYLTQFTAVSGQSRAGIAAAVLAEPGMKAKTVKKSEADAGNSTFGADTRRSLTALRLRLGHWLDAQAPRPRDRWHDPRPKPHDPRAVRAIEVVKE